jgi:hypothetical protein
MVQTLPIEPLTLYDLEQQFGLQEVADGSFFLRMAGKFACAQLSRTGKVGTDRQVSFALRRSDT